MKVVTTTKQYCLKCEDITYHRVEIEKTKIVLKICMRCNKTREIEDGV